MPANSALENNIESQNEAENNQAVELMKSKAMSKRAEQSEDYTAAQSQAPKTEEAELLPQEYGQPTEDKNKEEPGEEPKEDEEEPENGEQPEADEEMSEEEMRSLQFTESQMRQLKTQKAVAIEERNTIKKISKLEKKIKTSQKTDETQNAVRIIRAIWGWALVYWWLLLIPLVFALAITIALGVLVWGCGINLGYYSAQTKELQKRFKNDKKSLIKQKNERIKKIQSSFFGAQSASMKLNKPTAKS